MCRIIVGMLYLLSVVVAAGAAFVATNIEDLLILILLMSRGDLSKRAVVTGQFLGIGTLVVVALAAALGAQLAPDGWTRWLGVLPMLIGAKWLVEKLRASGEGPETPTPLRQGALAMASVTVANGGDNIGVYTPLFATLDGPGVAVTVLVFALLTGVWCATSHALVSLPRAGGRVVSVGTAVAPWALLGLGAGILLELI